MSMLRGTIRALGMSALAGLVLWGIVAGVAIAVDDPTLDLVAVLLLFAQLVLVPLGLAELRLGGGPIATALLRGAWWLCRPGAVAALVALAIPTGEVSAAVAAVALLPALAAGAAALVSLRSVLTSWAAFARVAAAGFLVVGAVSFVLHRQGGGFAGFPEHIVQLTAVHFHVAGFGLALVAARLVGVRRRIGTVAVLLLVAGMAITAIGFLTVPAVQVAGALLVTGAVVAVAGGTATALTLVGSLAARRLLLVSSLAGWVVATLAATYAVSEAFGAPILSIRAMAAVHGTTAAIGFVGAGLVGWRLAGRS